MQNDNSLKFVKIRHNRMSMADNSNSQTLSNSPSLESVSERRTRLKGNKAREHLVNVQNKVRIKKRSLNPPQDKWAANKVPSAIQIKPSIQQARRSLIMSRNPEIEDISVNDARNTDVNVSIDQSYKDESAFKAKPRSTPLEVKRRMQAEKSKFATVAQDPEDAYFYPVESLPPASQFKLRKNA